MTADWLGSGLRDLALRSSPPPLLPGCRGGDLVGRGLRSLPCAFWYVRSKVRASAQTPQSDALPIGLRRGSGRPKLQGRESPQDACWVTLPGTNGLPSGVPWLWGSPPVSLRFAQHVCGSLPLLGSPRRPRWSSWCLSVGLGLQVLAKSPKAWSTASHEPSKRGPFLSSRPRTLPPSGNAVLIVLDPLVQGRPVRGPVRTARECQHSADFLARV